MHSVVRTQSCCGYEGVDEEEVRVSVAVQSQSSYLDQIQMKK